MAISERPLRRVLLIDDTPEIAELLSFALRDRGFDVVVMGYTDRVNELVTEQHADMVVLDCSSFDMNESLFDIIRGDPDYGALPVVIISDTPDEAVRSLRARQARQVRIVPKPFTGSHVATALDELLAP